jgi:hypothetical protein
MAISITEDIRSITELKRNTNAVLDQIHKTKRPGKLGTLPIFIVDISLNSI